jgi:hypothetical protein
VMLDSAIEFVKFVGGLGGLAGLRGLELRDVIWYRAFRNDVREFESST